MALRSRLSKAPAALLFPPPVLRKRYAVGQQIGYGGSSQVFSAWDAQAAQQVVLKRAHLGEKGRLMLRHEAEVLAFLQHPAIPTFLDSFEEEGRCYLVEEWRAGSPLASLRFFSLARVLWIGQQCCEALAYVHEQGIMHGDLAPGNLLFTRRAFSLIDFGFARRSGDPPRPKGTPGYAAPEQWKTGRFNPASDIYSLGMLLGCALTDVEAEEVQRARSFRGLWDDPADLSASTAAVLALLDQMIAPSPAARPDLAEIQRTLTELSQRDDLDE